MYYIFSIRYIYYFTFNLKSFNYLIQIINTNKYFIIVIITYIVFNIHKQCILSINIYNHKIHNYLGKYN